MNTDRKSPEFLFKLFAIAEALTWTMLIFGLLMRAIMGFPQLLLTVIGGIHGAVFLTYAVIAALVGVNNRWGFWRIALGVALAIVPYATIPFEKKMDASGRLKGSWRREHSGHPGDDHWFDRLYRWFLNRPALLAATLVLVVVAIFATLLILGPPGGWAESN